jgi:flagellar biosynthesis protein FliQ
MDIGIISQISREALYVLLATSLPILLIALFVGLIISFFQALTQIQETSLTFVPKIVAVSLSMILLIPYMLSKLSVFFDHIIQLIIK